MGDKWVTMGDKWVTMGDKFFDKFLIKIAPFNQSILKLEKTLT